MAANFDAGALEHLTPHDLVTYSRCPYEMELHHSQHSNGGTPARAPMTPENVVPLHRSPLFDPPMHRAQAIEGRLDLGATDTLVYLDARERGLPMLFPPERIRLDPTLAEHEGNLVDREWNFSGRPDLIVRRADGSPVPIEYKSTHLFVGYHEAHGRLFDAIQAIAECRLTHQALGVRPSHGIVLYGDVDGEGAREGFVEVPYGPAEESWLKVALAQIRADRTRAPVPSERHCGGCESNRAGLCRYAVARSEPLPAAPVGGRVPITAH